MGHKKRKNKTPEEPNNKKVAKLNSEDGGGNEEAATQKVTVEIVEKKEEVEPKKTEGNGSQSSGKKKKKKKNANKGANAGANAPKVDENVVPNNDFVDDYVFTKEDAEKILECFSKEDLTEVLKSALKKHGDIGKDIADLALKDSAKRKLFVRGLAWDTKLETLKSVFSVYGEIEKADIIMDKSSGKNRGFGFVTYKSFAGVMAALKEPSKKIDDRITVCHLASGTPPPDPQQVTARKIYVGGLPKDVDSDKLVKLFSQYGEIEEGPLGFDKVTGKSKGFAFFIYKSEKSAKNALEEPTKPFDGATLTCKAAPRKNNNGTKNTGTNHTGANNTGTPYNMAPSKALHGNMWAYGSPMGGFIPVGNFGSPLFQQAFSNRKNR